MDQTNLANDIWQIAELLRGDFKQSEYGLVILPFTVLRRLECVLEPTREAVRKRHKAIAEKGYDLDRMLTRASGVPMKDSGLDAEQFRQLSDGS